MEGLEKLDLELEGRSAKRINIYRPVKNIFMPSVTSPEQFNWPTLPLRREKRRQNMPWVNWRGRVVFLWYHPAFTPPEIASAGLTEEAAREAYGDDLLIGTFPTAALGKALAMGKTEGSFKLIAQAATKKLLGVHIFGANATDLYYGAGLGPAGWRQH